MRLECCCAMINGQCNDCPLTAPIRPQPSAYPVDAVTTAYRAGLAEGFRQGVQAADCLPTTWLDPLLSGDDKVIDKSPVPEIEMYTYALGDRIRALRPEGEK